jgi:hypothetical protein
MLTREKKTVMPDDAEAPEVLERRKEIAERLIELCGSLVDEEGYCPCCVDAVLLTLALGGNPVDTVTSLSMEARAMLRDALNKVDALNH